uniref:Uncharacterized protein n=1 Tax=Acrobeloides nanus TaxID=290746 RepID=A0A914D044_9BILA
MKLNIFIFASFVIFSNAFDPHLVDNVQAQFNSDFINILLKPSTFFQDLNATLQSQVLSLFQNASLTSQNQFDQLTTIVNGLPLNVQLDYVDLFSKEQKVQVELNQQLEMLEKQFNPKAKQILDQYWKNIQKISFADSILISQNAYNNLLPNVQTDCEKFLNQYQYIYKQLLMKYASQTPTQNNLQTSPNHN